MKQKLAYKAIKADMYGLQSARLLTGAATPCLPTIYIPAEGPPSFGLIPNNEPHSCRALHIHYIYVILVSCVSNKLIFLIYLQFRQPIHPHFSLFSYKQPTVCVYS
jgi:hypothetical protein